MTNANDPEIVELRRIHGAVVNFLNDDVDDASELASVTPAEQLPR